MNMEILIVDLIVVLDTYYEMKVIFSIIIIPGLFFG